MTSTGVINTVEWIQENEKFFLPPVCNKMMHNDGQMKHFYVGGPNSRKDYHLEEGEELFYMVRGDMCLKVVEQGVHKDVPIKQGEIRLVKNKFLVEIFLLTGKIPHSPQRSANTVGLVIERERHKTELDGLRYFVEVDGKPTLEPLYERWFYCDDLGSQLGPIIKAYFASEQHKTGKPIPGTIPKPAFEIDTTTKLTMPFSLNGWIEDNRKEIEEKGFKTLFGSDEHQFQVDVFGPGENTDKCDAAEIWIWQLEGSSVVSLDGVSHNLKKDDSLLVPVASSYTAKRPSDSLALICYQDPGKKK